MKRAIQQQLGSVSHLIIETHCLPSSIFIEHLQCTRHNRTYRRHCPCSWGAYILKGKKNTPLLKWHFCLVFSVKYWGNTWWGVSFGYDLAPSFEERKRKDCKGRWWQTIQGRISREINTSSTEESRAVVRRVRGAVGCKQRKRDLRHRVEPEKSCGLFSNTRPPCGNGWWQDSRKEEALCTWRTETQHWESRAAVRAS